MEKCFVVVWSCRRGGCVGVLEVCLCPPVVLRRWLVVVFCCGVWASLVVSWLASWLCCFCLFFVFYCSRAVLVEVQATCSAGSRAIRDWGRAGARTLHTGDGATIARKAPRICPDSTCAGRTPKPPVQPCVLGVWESSAVLSSS